VAVDGDSGITVASAVSKDHTDHKLLKPMIEQAKENLRSLSSDTKIFVDNGYYFRTIIRICQSYMPILQL